MQHWVKVKDKNRVVIEWRTKSGFGAPADGVWGEFCIVESDRKPGKEGEAKMIVDALNAFEEAFEYRVQPEKPKPKGKQ